MDRALASDLSYLVLKKQRRERELSALPLYQPYQRAYPKGLTVGEEVERISGEPVPLAVEIDVRHEH